ncbi:D-alanyl-D-alanine carboxypeptidase family protein [Bradyrhizobium icense]|uniref:D-alanyl-D-alanine carboxypeptidase family protein n=1 Tax=Bradyrhizobium icense TaxID=1274631 RepID=UPI000A509748|nr:D-alanyl-D-alanine carboxypeptidase family protein [Bradyrhizobium icense]
MDPWRLATTAQRRINVLLGLALASWILVCLAGFDSASTERVSASVVSASIKNADASIENADAPSIVERQEPSLIATAEPTRTPPVIALASAAIDAIDVPIPTASVIEKAPDAAKTPDTTKAPDTTAGLEEPKPVVVAALTDPAEILPPEVSSAEIATTITPDSAPDNAAQTVRTIEINEECLVAEPCIDRYLWALYERAPKIDAIKVHERRKVTVKRKGKTVTVTKTFTRRVDEDFTWKDPKAAERAGMTMMDYVIGGMDKSFKLKLFHMLHAAEQAGLSPGITSAFRDDYRQSIASGLKAASDRSYHGGSLRGGYGRGLAADVVSVKGASRAQRWVSTEKFWKWIDEHGKEFGIGRPYLDRDPPHVGPIDGKEYASRRGGTKTPDVQASAKKRVRVTARHDHKRHDHKVAKQAKTTKQAKTAKLSKGRTM